MSPASMSAAVLALIVLVALLLPVAPFAINHGARQLHARRHAACLHRIAQLEVDVGFVVAEAPLEEKVEAFVRERHTTSPAAAANEKAWKRNRKRLAEAPVQRHRRRGY